MHKNHTNYVFPIILTVIAIGLLGYWLISLVGVRPNLPPLEVSAAEKIYRTDPLIPVRIVIPKIAVDTTVEHVGIGSNGHMKVPSSYATTAWYEPGFKPGDLGHAVIAGHLDNGLGLKAVFAHLKDLEVGDRIYLYDSVQADSSPLVFQVVKKESYPDEAAPLSDIYGSSTGKYLNLITCSGNWIQARKSYDERLVVTARLVE
jgi:LPXTG-site transpeptidase (sortase) family protein